MTLIHVLTGPKTTTKRELEQLGKMDKYQRRFLKNKVCGLCEYELNKPGCGGFFGRACSEQTRVNRRDRALKHYNPRINRRKK